MKRSTKWLVGITATIITFASLMAIAGSAHFGHNGKDPNGCPHHHGYNQGKDVNKNIPNKHLGNKPIQGDSTTSER